MLLGNWFKKMFLTEGVGDKRVTDANLNIKATTIQLVSAFSL